MASRLDHHQRAPRRLGLLIAAGCVVLAGCGTGLGDASGPGSTSTTAAGAPSSSEPAPDADADADAQVIAAVDTTLSAPSFTLSSAADLSAGPAQFNLVFAGSVDYPKLIADMTLSVESGAEAVETEVRSDGTTVWIRVEGDAAAELGIPDNKSWVEGDATQLTEMGTFEQSGLLGVIYTLRAADGTETIGTDELDGVEVTRYRTTVTYDDALEAAGADAEALKSSLSLKAATPVGLDIDVAVGSDGVIREFVLHADEEADGVRLLADYRVTLTEVGGDVAFPDAPPKNETVTGSQAETILDALSD